ncbi:MAG: phytanoyl-CoA dioxygenase family protein [Planctomycetota bacterium]|nr:phytanoyl-CoA dioxygenase family protein [Planctomycetota bacterium]
MPEKPFSESELAAYEADGFVVVENLLNPRETELLAKVSHGDNLDQERMSRADGEGGSVDLLVRNVLSPSIYSAIVRSRRVVRRMEQLLHDEVYHYHHKMILKEPHVGGAWTWHQDYGYWYNNGCLLPELASCMIAVDRATRENGCLQVIRGSHHMGRVDHKRIGEQTGADPDRVAVAVQRMETVYLELEPGSAVFFHCNLLHRSDRNTSDLPRWAFICCYNTKRNDPYKDSEHPRYSRLDVWPDKLIAEMGEIQWMALQDHS